MERSTQRNDMSSYRCRLGLWAASIACFALLAGCDTGMDKYNDLDDDGIPDDQEEPVEDENDETPVNTVDDCTSLCAAALVEVGNMTGCRVECGVNILPNFSGTVVTSVAVLLNNIVSGDFEGGQSCELVTSCDTPCGELLGECMSALPDPPEVEMLSVCANEYQECLDSSGCYDAFASCNDTAYELQQTCLASGYTLEYCEEIYEDSLVTCTCLYDACLTGGDASNCDDDAESAARVASPVQTGPSRFQVTRGLIDQQLARLSALSTETFVMPGLDNAGKLSGFKLGSIRPDNVLYSLGLRNGDVLVAINGKSLIHDTSLDDLLALRKSSQVKLTLRRKGVQRDLTYDIAQK